MNIHYTTRIGGISDNNAENYHAQIIYSEITINKSAEK